MCYADPLGKRRVVDLVEESSHERRGYGHQWMARAVALFCQWHYFSSVDLPRWHNRLARRTYSQYLLAMSHAEVVSSSLTRGTLLTLLQETADHTNL